VTTPFQKRSPAPVQFDVSVGVTEGRSATPRFKWDMTDKRLMRTSPVEQCIKSCLVPVQGKLPQQLGVRQHQAGLQTLRIAEGVQHVGNQLAH
jgi:hypothetical protein